MLPGNVFLLTCLLKVDFQGSRVTSDGGLVLVRELDERLGFSELIKQHLTDSRAKNTQLPLTDLLRQSIYSRMAGYEDVNDAERLAQDPTFRLIGSAKIWERGAALTSRLQSFETELLTREENLAGLGARYFLSKLPGKHGKGPYILSVVRPLSSAEGSPDRFLLQDLSSVPPRMLTPWLKAFVEQAAREAFWQSGDSATLALRIRTALAQAGDDLGETVDKFIFWGGPASK
jgi:hypothetical protein